MLFFSALCALLPLALALDTCDDAKSEAFQAKTLLEGNLLNNFGDKKFWFVASGANGAESGVSSTEITFGSVSDNSVGVSYVFRDASGETVKTSTTTFVLDGQRILAQDGKVAFQFFQCTNNIIGAYRCQTEGTSGSSGPAYLMWAAWDKTDSDVSGEVAACTAEFQKVDSSATFVSRSHP